MYPLKLSFVLQISWLPLCDLVNIVSMQWFSVPVFSLLGNHARPRLLITYTLSFKSVTVSSFHRRFYYFPCDQLFWRRAGSGRLLLSEHEVAKMLPNCVLTDDKQHENKESLKRVEDAKEDLKDEVGGLEDGEQTEDPG